MYSVLTKLNHRDNTYRISTRNLEKNTHWHFDGADYIDGKTGVGGFRVVAEAGSEGEGRKIAAAFEAAYALAGYKKIAINS